MTTVETPIALKGNAEISIEPSINIRPGERTAILYVNSDTAIEYKPRKGGWAFIALDPENRIHQYFFEPDVKQDLPLRVERGWTFVWFAHRRFGEAKIDYRTVGESPVFTPSTNPPEQFLRIVEFLEDKNGKFA